MALLGINTGSTANDGTGDPIRVAMGKINSNFNEIYNTIGNGTTLSSYVASAGIATLAENLVGNPIISVSGIFNPGITTTEHIEVRNITSVGIITAVQFIGDGSQLSNVTATFPGLDVLDDNVRRGVARELNFGDRIVTTGPDPVGRVTISADSYSPTAGLSSVSVISGYSSTSGYASSSGVSSSLYNSEGRVVVGLGTTSGFQFSEDGVLTATKDITISSRFDNPTRSRITLTEDPGDDLTIEKFGGVIKIRIADLGTSNFTDWEFFANGVLSFPDGTLQTSGFSGYASTAGISSTSESLIAGTDINAGIVTAATFFGDGSGLTGIVATGSGIEIKEDGTLVGTATTIDFRQTLSISVGSGVATVSGPNSVSYANVSGLSTVSTTSNTSLYSEVSGVSTTSEGLTGSPDIIVGIVTSSLIIPDRIYSKIQRITTDSNILDLRSDNAITGRFIVITASQNCDVALPQPTLETTGWELIIKNKSNTSQLFIAEFDGTGIRTLDPTQTGIFINDGEVWSPIF
jgi:hypothetical protein